MKEPRKSGYVTSTGSSKKRCDFAIRCVGWLLIICCFALVGPFIFFELRRNAHHSEPNQLFFITNHSKESPEIRVTIDHSVIFDGKVQTTIRMPAIVFDQRLDLLSGHHVIRLEDRTRGITEVKSFDIPGTRTIFVGTEKSALTDDHIVLYKELIYPK